MNILKNLTKGLILAALLLAGQSVRAATNEVGGYLTGTHNWTAGNVYVLTNYTYVMSNAVLNIQAGTVIKGRDGTAPNFGSLFVTRGGKINANGTKQQPIIFTAEADDVSNPSDMPTSGAGSRGLWGGLVILGNATINNSTAGSAVEPRYDVYEGLADTDVSGERIHRFGGTNDLDNSGVLRYVSIRHGGKLLESAKEINGLSLGGVGAGTTIEYVECYLIADDGFEFFGGSVNTKYLVSAFNDDDAFDTDQGYHGKNQFWFAIQEPGVRDEGHEANGQPNSPVVVIPGAVPLSSYEIYNATFIGAGTGGSGNDAFNIRVHNFCKIYNGVFTDFQGNRINIDGTSAPDIQDNIFFNFVGNGTGYGTAFAPTASNPSVDPLLKGISRTQNGGLDPRPNAGSPALTSVRTAPNNGFYTQVASKGAFDGNNLWIAGWTALSQNGFLPSVPTPPVITVGGYLTGTHKWSATNIYVLTNYTYVMSNAVLTIEAGTVIKGRDGTAPNFGSLFVTRGGKINASGTKQNPIIFTAEADDVTNPGDMPTSGAGSRGLWGGLVLLGNATINNSAAGSAVEPRYDVYEGLADTDVSGERIHRFGGTNDLDNSGVLRYVSIRHGGKLLESAKEINGLSMGGVGSGTTVEYVECYLIADDGFEFFGGSVNTKYLVSAFNDDDAFDTDHGYHGKNQFWFSIQEPGVRDEGHEANGQPSSPVVVIPGSVPLSAYEIYNATFIGAGTGGSGNDAFNIRVHNFCKIYNGVFTDFQGNRINIDGTSQPDVQDNIFFNFVGNGTGYGTAFAPAASNPSVDPLLKGISRTPNGGLDPRPNAGSPALTSSRTAPSNGFYTQVASKGAFDGNNLWIAGWTALSQNGFAPAVAPTASETGPSTTQEPYVEAMAAGVGFTALLKAGDSVGGYRMVGLPDGMGAFDNGDGTYTVLIGHELGSSAGIARAHGGIGALVSKWVISKASGQVISGQDLMTNVYLFNTGTLQYDLTANVAFNRFCSADLPAVSAFYNSASGLGTQNRIFMNGEEGGNGRGLAHIVTGADAGKSFELAYLGRMQWENAVASPHAQDKTIVAGLDDASVNDSRVFFYIGTKLGAGNDVQKAGLIDGKTYAITVAGLAAEATTTTEGQRTFSLTTLGTAGNVVGLTLSQLKADAVSKGTTAFRRVEDGAWNPVNPREFYFVTTSDATTPSRLWRLTFYDIANPESGGVIDMMLNGTEGQIMMDNMCFDAQGNIIITEDPGGNNRLSRLWKYYPATDGFIPLAQAKSRYFTTGQANFITIDEELSGVIDMSQILGSGVYLFATQVHSSTPVSGPNQTELVEGGQMALMYLGSEAPVFSGQPTPVSVAPGTPAVFTVAATPGATIQWYKNGVPIANATGTTYTIPAPTTADGAQYVAVVTTPSGSVASMAVSLTVTDLYMYAGVVIAGPIGRQYDIQYTASLDGTPVWTQLERVTLTTSPMVYIDYTSPGQGKRFYRALEVTPQ
jgi:hypothetical protein